MLRQRKIIDLRDTDKSRYSAETKFYNCFVIHLSRHYVLYLYDAMMVSQDNSLEKIVEENEWWRRYWSVQVENGRVRKKF